MTDTSQVISIHGVVFQTILAPDGRLDLLIAQRPGAVQPEFVALRPTNLVYQVGLEERLKEVFGQEEGKHLAETLGIAKSTVWYIRKALGIADIQLGGSRTTRWRRSKLTQHSETSVDADAVFEEEP